MYSNDKIAGRVPVADDHDIQFALRMKDDAMKEAGILAGSIVLCREQSEVENGEVAVVLVGDKDAIIRRYYKHTNGIIELRPASTEHETVLVMPKEAETVVVKGRVMLVICEVQ